MTYPALAAFAEDPGRTYARWCVLMALQPPFLSFAAPTEIRLAELQLRARVSRRATMRALEWLEASGYIMRSCSLDSQRECLTLAWLTPAQWEDPMLVDSMQPAHREVVAPRPTPLAVRVHAHQRRARKRNAEGQHTARDVEARYALQGGRCFYCGTALNDVYHIEHMIPLARGGGNGVDNICCACSGCNLKKGRKTADEFLATRKLA